MSVEAACPGCKERLASHPRSGRFIPAPVDGIVVVHGRCIVGGVRAPQKLCWAVLLEPVTLDDYLGLYADHQPDPPRCPACGGPTGYHGTYTRNVANDAGTLTPVPMYRFVCGRAECPVVTITLYPVCITPYMQVPTQVREDAVRTHDEGRMSWERIAEGIGVASDTLRRWARRLRARAPALAAAFMAAVSDFDPRAILPPARAGPALWVLGAAAADAVHLTRWPRIAVARLDLIRGPMPVWA